MDTLLVESPQWVMKPIDYKKELNTFVKRYDYNKISPKSRKRLYSFQDISNVPNVPNRYSRSIGSSEGFIISTPFQKFLLPQQLKNLEEEIIHSKYILDLKEDWDEYGAKSIESSLWFASIKFLIDYSKFILSNFGVRLSSPEINPCANGTMDLSWRTSNARMLINLKSHGEEIKANFYGDLLNDKDKIKDNILVNKINPTLAAWMVNLGE